MLFYGACHVNMSELKERFAIMEGNVESKSASGWKMWPITKNLQPACSLASQGVCVDAEQSPSYTWQQTSLTDGSNAGSVS